MKEFERLKDEEHRQQGWDIKRNLVKINYRIYTDAMKENLIPTEITPHQMNQIYAVESVIMLTK